LLAVRVSSQIQEDPICHWHCKCGPGSGQGSLVVSCV
jgi:hypothetical protein